MAKNKKVTRKQLLKEPDEFLTFSSKMFNYAMANKKTLIGIFSGILLLLIVFAAVQYVGYRSENRASALFSEAWSRYEVALEDTDPVKAYNEVDRDFQDLLADYGNTEAGKLGRVMYAHIAYEAGESDRAVRLYETALPSFKGDPALENLVLSGLGYACEQQNAHEKSVLYFERIVAGESPVLKSEAYFNLGRIYNLLDNAEKSRKAYETIVSDYADSIYADLVKEQLAG